jgi:hypothetical protein
VARASSRWASEALLAVEEVARALQFGGSVGQGRLGGVYAGLGDVHRGLGGVGLCVDLPPVDGGYRLALAHGGADVHENALERARHARLDAHAGARRQVARQLEGGLDGSALSLDGLHVHRGRGHGNRSFWGRRTATGDRDRERGAGG